tara:strand:+ start:412 stop:600 length:189 start_codon:yes stop_codon:yes gene_type:complete
MGLHYRLPIRLLLHPARRGLACQGVFLANHRLQRLIKAKGFMIVQVFVSSGHAKYPLTNNGV